MFRLPLFSVKIARYFIQPLKQWFRFGLAWSYPPLDHIRVSKSPFSAWNLISQILWPSEGSNMNTILLLLSEICELLSYLTEFLTTSYDLTEIFESQTLLNSYFQNYNSNRPWSKWISDILLCLTEFMINSHDLTEIFKSHVSSNW